MNKFPKINIENNSQNMSAWFCEKTNKLNYSIANLIDVLKINKNDEELQNILKDIVSTSMKLFTISTGISNYNYNDNDIIIKEGSHGYQKLLDKYKISKKDLDELFINITEKH